MVQTSCCVSNCNCVGCSSAALYNYVHTPYYHSPIRMGWQCPRCNVIHSPDTSSCYCVDRTWGSPVTTDTVTVTTSGGTIYVDGGNLATS